MDHSDGSLVRTQNSVEYTGPVGPCETGRSLSSHYPGIVFLTTIFYGWCVLGIRVLLGTYPLSPSRTRGRGSGDFRPSVSSSQRGPRSLTNTSGGRKKNTTVSGRKGSPDREDRIRRGKGDEPPTRPMGNQESNPESTGPEQTLHFRSRRPTPCSPPAETQVREE